MMDNHSAQLAAELRNLACQLRFLETKARFDAYSHPENSDKPTVVLRAGTRVKGSS